MDDLQPSAKRPRVGRIFLEVPNSDVFMGMIRIVVGRAARMAGFTFDGIEDISLAVDEAAVLLLGVSSAPLGMKIDEPDPGRLTVALEVDTADGRWPPLGLEDDTRWQILAAVCEEVWFLDGGRTGVGLAQSVR